MRPLARRSRSRPRSPPPPSDRDQNPTTSSFQIQGYTVSSAAAALQRDTMEYDRGHTDAKGNHFFRLRHLNVVAPAVRQWRHTQHQLAESEDASGTVQAARSRRHGFALARMFEQDTISRRDDRTHVCRRQHDDDKSRSIRSRNCTRRL